MARLASESKGGFYATPIDELQLLCKRIRLRYQGEEAQGAGEVRIIDPCCGEGEALNMLAISLQEQGADVKSYGVELEQTRYEKARQVIDHVILDGYEFLRTQPMFSLLWLNPPYQEGFSERTELTFLRALSSVKHGLLQKDGLLMFCIPQYVVRDSAAVLSGRFRNIRVYRFTDDNYDVFKQVVVIANLGKASGEDSKKNYKWLRSIGEGEKDMLPTLADIDEDIVVDISEGELGFYRAGKMNPEELARDLAASPLFDELNKRMLSKNMAASMKRPMLPLKPTHMGVAIASGAVGGNMGTHIVAGITKRRKDVSDIFNDDGFKTGEKVTEFFQSIVRVFTPDTVCDLE
ncbi:DUF6094 domain-containing protein [Cohnella sp. AR92]|uniref:DUF6094 domain-containing protein n=1 Tax=Cohnella sp. AR92 TaxID=648716 RepID=UPI000F8F536D|nr:DUF6094 domain-containing protein [Cohnella sp. AR92]RUS44921.1 hypothetical protein ELR57_21945 [Cohnella sp. AR92]